MKKRYCIALSFDGTHYHGWQIQRNAHSVQAEIESKLWQIFQQKIEITGCGRTDTGVHAKKYFAHFDIENIEVDVQLLKHKLNIMLPNDISIERVFEVESTFHARFDAVKRSYEYHIHFYKNPFLRHYSYYLHHGQTLSIDKMNEACALLIGKQDFASFSKSRTQVDNFICEIYLAKWESTASGIRFTITANRFLRNMVRAIVGTMLMIGKGEIESAEMKKIIEAKDRKLAGTSVPAEGLYLTEIMYTNNQIF